MLRARKKQKGTSVARLEAQGTETKNYIIENLVRLVIVNNMPTSMALAACFLEDSVPYSTIYSRVKAQRMQGTYDGLIRKRLDDARLELDAQLLTEKDWGDVVRWVLLVSKLPFLLKDLKKRDQIVAKLATLPNDWTTYIPRVAVVQIIPPTAGVKEEV